MLQNLKNERHLTTVGDIENVPRRLHYVPRFWIKQFACDGKVYNFGWGHQEGSKFGNLHAPKNCMCEPHFLNATDTEDKPHVTVEPTRGYIEERVARCWDRMLRSGSVFVNRDLAFKMDMSEFLANLLVVAPWRVGMSKALMSEMLDTKYASHNISKWKGEEIVLRSVTEEQFIAPIMFMLFARNWEIREVTLPLALPSMPILAGAELLSKPIVPMALALEKVPVVAVPVSPRHLLTMCWSGHADIAPRKAQDVLLSHTRFMYHDRNKDYRRMIVSPKDKRQWSVAYKRYKKKHQL